MSAPKRYFLWTTLLLEVEAPIYAQGKDLDPTEIHALILQAAQAGTLKCFGTQQAITKTEAKAKDLALKGPEGL